MMQQRTRLAASSMAAAVPASGSRQAVRGRGGCSRSRRERGRIAWWERRGSGGLRERDASRRSGVQLAAAICASIRRASASGTGKARDLATSRGTNPSAWVEGNVPSCRLRSKRAPSAILSRGLADLINQPNGIVFSGARAERNTCRLCITLVSCCQKLTQESRQGRRALHASTPQIFSSACSARFCAQEPGLARLTPAAPGPTLCREPSRGGRRSSRPKRSRFRSPAVVRSRPQPPRSHLRCRSGRWWSHRRSSCRARRAPCEPRRAMLRD